MYDDSISHLSENFIRRILEVQEAFLKHPDDVAMMVYNLSDALQKLGVDIMRTFFESIDQWLCNKSIPNVNANVRTRQQNVQMRPRRE